MLFIKNSKFLTVSGLKNLANSIVTSEDRDPLIFLRQSNSNGLYNSDSTHSAFELSFGKASFNNAFSNKSYGNPYFQDLEDFMKTPLD